MMNALSPEDAFQRTERLFGKDILAALAQTRVCIVGTGGVGGWCAEALVRTGIGHITLVDDDRVAVSNLNRQVTATLSTLGQFKVDVLAERLRAINPNLDVIAKTTRYTPETRTAFDFTQTDFVIDAIDSVRCKADLIRTVTDLEGITLFSSMGAACRTDLSRIRTSAFAKVVGDGLARALRQCFKKEGKWPTRSFICVWSDEQAENQAPPSLNEPRANGSFMPVTATFGLHLATLVIHAVQQRVLKQTRAVD